MYFKGLTFIFSEDPPENHFMVIGGLLLKYNVLLLLLLLLLLLSSSHNVCLESLGPRPNHGPGALGDSQFLA